MGVLLVHSSVGYRWVGDSFLGRSLVFRWSILKKVIGVFFDLVVGWLSVFRWSILRLVIGVSVIHPMVIRRGVGWSMLSLFSVVHSASVGGLLMQFLVGHQGLSDSSLHWASVFRCC